MAKLKITHLTDDMRLFFRHIDRKYQLEDHHRRVLDAGCRAHDRMTEAGNLVAKVGILIKTRSGDAKVNPAVAIERDSRVAFLRCLRELGLADEVDAPRPPRPSGRYH